MRKIKYVFALLAAVLALTTAAFAAEPGDALVPVGEAVAISLRCDGVVVSALADIASEGGACCPAGEAGVQAGDKIVAVNGERVTGAEDFLRRAAAFSASCRPTAQDSQKSCILFSKYVLYCIMQGNRQSNFFGGFAPLFFF